MEKKELQKKYNNSILACYTEYDINKVFNICDSMDLTASESKQKARCSTWNNSSMTSIG